MVPTLGQWAQPLPAGDAPLLSVLSHGCLQQEQGHTPHVTTNTRYGTRNAPEKYTPPIPQVHVIERRGLRIPSKVEVTCHVTGFYPRAVQVEWLGSEGLPLVDVVSNGEVLPNGDGSYQLRKSLTVPQGAQGGPIRETTTVTPKSDHGTLYPKNIQLVMIDDVIVYYYNSSAEQEAIDHIYQAHGCCGWKSDATTEAFVSHAYDGKEIVSFDIWKILLGWSFITNLDASVGWRNCYNLVLQFENPKRLPHDNSAVEVTCHVTGFYPWAVQVEWLGSEGLPLVDVLSNGEVLPNGDGSYQLRKSLTVPQGAQYTQNYNCQVLHSSVVRNITLKIKRKRMTND
ncbi:unnamed protein product [Coregonus sp. 'balchen']|nr:unnamed protein product [Coregonus sp. 'balchen']